MLRNRVNTVPSVRKIELSRENFCSGEPKLINFSTCRSSLEGCGRINQHFPNGEDFRLNRCPGSVDHYRLNREAPVDLLTTQPGYELVDDYLSRMEHGIYS